MNRASSFRTISLFILAFASFAIAWFSILRGSKASLSRSARIILALIIRVCVNYVDQPAYLLRLKRLRVYKPILRLFNFLIARALLICESSISAAIFLVEVLLSFITVSGDNVSGSPSKRQCSIPKTLKLSTMIFIITYKRIRLFALLQLGF